MADKTRLCFVCLGNIVRSPLAKNLFLHLAAQRGAADKYEVDSAGTAGYHAGDAPDSRMRGVAARHGLKYTGSARQLRAGDFDRFDQIIVMDNENMQDVLRLARTPADREKVHLLREFDPLGGPRAIVPDPYYGGIEGFEEVYRIVERSANGLLDALEANGAVPKEQG